MDSTTVSPAAPSAAPGSPDLRPDLMDLRNQINGMLRALLLLITMLAGALVLELWQCWALRPQAHQATQMRAALQQISATAQEFSRAAARYPELVAIGRKYGVEPTSMSGGPNAPGGAPAPKLPGNPP